MFSKLSIMLTLCISSPLHCSTNLQKAQENYHNTPQYKKWQEFKQKLEENKTLDNLNQEFFDAQKTCNQQSSFMIHRSSKKCSSTCIQAQELSEKIVELKNQLHDLEEAAIQTHEGQEYLRQRQAFFGKK